jgi:hypothetical protein
MAQKIILKNLKKLEMIFLRNGAMSIHKIFIQKLFVKFNSIPSLFTYLKFIFWNKKTKDKILCSIKTFNNFYLCNA